MLGLLLFWLIQAFAPGRLAYAFELLPAEHRQMQDPETGAELLFITTHPAVDTNLYFHERSFLADESLLLFNSSRKEGGLMGYLFETGQLVRLQTPQGALFGATAAKTGARFYALRGQEVLEIEISVRRNGQSGSLSVHGKERLIAVLPETIQPVTSLNESADGKRLSLGVAYPEGDRGIWLLGIRNKEARELCRIPQEHFHGHVQWSRTNPNFLSFAGSPNRLMVVDIRAGTPRAVYRERSGELVTHETWWRRNQILFVGGHREHEWHVKSLDIETGETVILGAGSWWPSASNSDLAKRNWWHAAASENFRWIAADTFHGSIAIFDAATTEMTELTHRHRTYGGGEHPHVGWDRKGYRVVFASNRLGDVNVCVATLPGKMIPRSPRMR